MTEKIKMEKRKKKGEVKILEIGEERRRKKEELTKKKGVVEKERRKRKREKKESDKGRDGRKKVKKRGNELKKKISIFIRTVPKMERYCSCVVKIITFGTSHKRGFLVFGVSNAKYLAFGTPDGNALRALFNPHKPQK